MRQVKWERSSSIPAAYSALINASWDKVTPSLNRYLPLRPPQEVNKLIIDQLEEEREALSFTAGAQGRQRAEAAA